MKIFFDGPLDFILTRFDCLCLATVIYVYRWKDWRQTKWLFVNSYCLIDTRPLIQQGRREGEKKLTMSRETILDPLWSNLEHRYNIHIHSKPPNEGHLSITDTWFCPILKRQCLWKHSLVLRAIHIYLQYTQ